jgi:hypothetical protein
MFPSVSDIFHTACLTLGLLADDTEWNAVIITLTSDIATELRVLNIILIDDYNMVPTHALQYDIGRLIRYLINTVVTLGGKLILLLCFTVVHQFPDSSG